MERKNDIIQRAGDIIRNGGIVLFPTETVYGIGANALDDEAVKKIFVAKGRAQDNPLILHIANMEMLSQIVESISDLEYRLMDAFWPGPLTIILPKKKGIANVATCYGDTVGVRMPSNKIAHDLIKAAGMPIAAPSANVSGKPSGTKLSDIWEELKDKVDGAIDGGETEIGIESTVVRVMDGTVKILRPGKITKEEIETIVSQVEVDEHVMGEIAQEEKVLSPGMKYRHYAPKTSCKLFYGQDKTKMINAMCEMANQHKKDAVLILAFTEDLKSFASYPCLDMGSEKNLTEVSHHIFSLLRKIDTYHVDLALIEGMEMKGLGLAIMNRLIRACEHDYYEIK